MASAWKAAQKGGYEEKMKKKRQGTRRRGQKSDKAKSRGVSLARSPLEQDHFSFLVDPGFQSSEYSDNSDGDKACCEVQDFLDRSLIYLVH
ncbi:hypothetical protein BDV93DRAFT_259674 [Ceratobasidium sp. AG-I]|nr:hypothetical protein BDV93DRAFT_259674 [Ceratobasidium sp. AG-I]